MEKCGKAILERMALRNCSVEDMAIRTFRYLTYPTVYEFPTRREQDQRQDVPVRPGFISRPGSTSRKVCVDKGQTMVRQSRLNGVPLPKIGIGLPT